MMHLQSANLRRFHGYLITSHAEAAVWTGILHCMHSVCAVAMHLSSHWTTRTHTLMSAQTHSAMLMPSSWALTIQHTGTGCAYTHFVQMPCIWAVAQHKHTCTMKR